MRTVFITSFHPHISRNILETKFLSLLRDRPDLKVVILAPDYKLKFFKDSFEKGNVIVEGVSPNQASKTARGIFFKKLGIYLFDSATTRLKLRFKLYQDKKILYYLFFSLLMFCGRSLWFQRFARALDKKFSPKGFFSGLLKKYKPDLIFATDIQNENDVSLMQDAERADIKVLGMVRSWDNMTQRVFRVWPDCLAVGSREIYDEIEFLHDYPKERAVITGQPHYDRYLKAPLKNKNSFFAEMGLDVAKRLILYAPIGDDILVRNDIDRYIISLLGLYADKLGAQVLVRLPTNLNLNLEGFRAPENVIFDKPGFAFGKSKALDQEITKADDDRLIDELYWSDVVVAGPTSVLLDGALLDKPLIAINFYPEDSLDSLRRPTSKRPYFEGLYHYDYVHIQKLLGTEGVREANTKTELKEAISDYFKNPKLDFAGRKKMREKWFSHADGHSSARLAKLII